MKLIASIKNDKISFVLICFIYFIFSYFIYSIYEISDSDHTSYLSFHKYIFYGSSVFLIWSHFKCFITNPGKLTHEYNTHILDFYTNIREYALLRGKLFTEKIGSKAFEHLPDNINSDDENTDYDDFEYPAVASIQDDVVDLLKKEHNINIKRCDRCYVVRFPGVKHCSRCQGCIMNMDHHCPWMFNCIGQFNQKYFLQFLVYSFVGISEVCIISIYYVYMKNKT